MESLSRKDAIWKAATFIFTCLVFVVPLVVVFFLTPQISLGVQERPPAGCRKLGLAVGSNLDDQYEEKYKKSSTPNNGTRSSPIGKVKALFVYPIKSCYPVELVQGEIVRTGMKYDRQFSFAQLISGQPELDTGKTSHTWKIITARQFPHLTKVKTEVWVPDPKSPTYTKNNVWVKSDGCIVVTFPFTPDITMSRDGLANVWKVIKARLAAGNFTAEPTVSFRLPFDPTAERIERKKYTREELAVFKDLPQALNVGTEIEPNVLAQLKYFLGVSNPLTLFRIDKQNYREVHRCAPTKEEVGYQPVIGLPDGYPLHLLNLASVRDVESHLPTGGPKSLNAIRFRANIYITGPPAFAEDAWKFVRIGSTKFQVSCRTARCVLPNVDPKTGVKDNNEPLSTLRSYRLIDEGAGTSPCLGMQMTPVSANGGEVKVGDEIEVLETGEHYYIKP
ncbi:hypothetical protein H2201_000062 [Coniosporium apollinis]|uniref:MOSC domain-containing protein n=1 Tax=Coniosporium apollinis TaxID=61459 RepID=A0ABQ9P6J0_9PEZI|nr:hypothetical protein H2201_000062 [Coniosporium apollinis]